MNVKTIYVTITLLAQTESQITHVVVDQVCNASFPPSDSNVAKYRVVLFIVCGTVSTERR